MYTALLQRSQLSLFEIFLLFFDKPYAIIPDDGKATLSCYQV